MSKTENQRSIRELVNRYYVAYNAQEWQTCLSLLSPHVVHEHPKGRDVGRKSFEQFVTCTAERQRFVDISIYASQSGRQAVVEYTVVGTHLNTTKGMSDDGAQAYRLQGRSIFQIERKIIVFISVYFDLKECAKQLEIDEVTLSDSFRTAIEIPRGRRLKAI